MLHRSFISTRTGFPRSGLEFPCLVITVLFLVLGSFTPFRVDVEALRAILAGGSVSFWPKCNVGDACVNLLIYVPLGASLFALMRGRFERNAACLLTVLCGAGLSLGLELGQLVLKGRYSSWWDVLFNTCGTIVGALVVSRFARTMVRRLLALRRSFLEAPFSATEGVVVFALLVMSMAPFDFVTTAKGLQASMREAQIPMAAAVVAGRPALTASDASQAWADLAAGDLGWSVAFAVLGYLFVVRNRRDSIGLCDAVFRSLGAGVLLAIVLEVLQLFASGHVFSLPDIAVHGVGVLVGVALAAVGDWRAHRQGGVGRTWAFGNEFLACVTLGQVMVILLPGYLGVMKIGGADGFVPVDWVPFADLLAMPFGLAASELLDAWCVYALMIVPMYVWLARLMPRWAGAVSVGFAVVVATVAGASGSGHLATGFSTQVLGAFIASYGTLCLTRFLVDDAQAMPLVDSVTNNSSRFATPATRLMRD
ncbi:MAG TPA: VanZ family protein [Phycisphaerae bacterium]|nr:VanZ family protein [Phycisphaerae bacterium]